MLSGVFRIWQRGHGECADRARAYDGGQGAKPPEAKTLFAFERSIEAANLPIFLKFAGKRQKRTFSYKVACKKFSWSGQGGHRTVPPLKTPLVILHASY